ncbi:MAG: radical SAM protein, partial [Candidatus Omnitrophica bacterium]|nr:radical SAM protein [Candidatus Omnitrophota bacterium]
MRKKAMLWEKLSDGNLRCDLCGHYCKISPGNFGRCGVRQNIEGRLFTCHYGKIIAKHVDPIEKKPL